MGRIHGNQLLLNLIRILQKKLKLQVNLSQVKRSVSDRASFEQALTPCIPHCHKK